MGKNAELTKKELNAIKQSDDFLRSLNESMGLYKFGRPMREPEGFSVIECLVVFLGALFKKGDFEANLVEGAFSMAGLMPPSELEKYWEPSEDTKDTVESARRDAEKTLDGAKTEKEIDFNNPEMVESVKAYAEGLNGVAKGLLSNKTFLNNGTLGEKDHQDLSIMRAYCELRKQNSPLVDVIHQNVDIETARRIDAAANITNSYVDILEAKDEIFRDAGEPNSERRQDLLARTAGGRELMKNVREFLNAAPDEATRNDVIANLANPENYEKLTADAVEAGKKTMEYTGLLGLTQSEIEPYYDIAFPAYAPDPEAPAVSELEENDISRIDISEPEAATTQAEEAGPGPEKGEASLSDRLMETVSRAIEGLEGAENRHTKKSEPYRDMMLSMKGFMAQLNEEKESPNLKDKMEKNLGVTYSMGQDFSNVMKKAQAFIGSLGEGRQPGKVNSQLNFAKQFLEAGEPLQNGLQELQNGLIQQRNQTRMDQHFDKMINRAEKLFGRDDKGIVNEYLVPAVAGLKALAEGKEFDPEMTKQNLAIVAAFGLASRDEKMQDRMRADAVGEISKVSEMSNFQHVVGDNLTAEKAISLSRGGVRGIEGQMVQDKLNVNKAREKAAEQITLAREKEMAPQIKNPNLLEEPSINNVATL